MDRKILRSVLADLGLIVYGMCAPVVIASGVESIAPSELETRIASSKGYLVVNITSSDPGCGYCARANPKYSRLANSTPEAHFVQVSWAPWRNFPDEIRRFLERNDITGIPARLVYQDGRLVNKLVGDPQEPTPVIPSAPTSPLKVTGTLAVIDSHQAAEKFRHTKGLLVVQLTSFETSCAFCIRSNPIFEELADAPENLKVKFVRVIYRPWEQMVNDPFGKAFGYAGLPIFATYQDGKLVRQHCGSSEQAELQKILLTGLE